MACAGRRCLRHWRKSLRACRRGFCPRTSSRKERWPRRSAQQRRQLRLQPIPEVPSDSWDRMSSLARAASTTCSKTMKRLDRAGGDGCWESCWHWLWRVAWGTGTIGTADGLRRSRLLARARTHRRRPARIRVTTPKVRRRPRLLRPVRAVQTQPRRLAVQVRLRRLL